MSAVLAQGGYCLCTIQTLYTSLQDWKVTQAFFLQDWSVPHIIKHLQWLGNGDIVCAFWSGVRKSMSRRQTSLWRSSTTQENLKLVTWCLEVATKWRNLEQERSWICGGKSSRSTGSLPLRTLVFFVFLTKFLKNLKFFFLLSLLMSEKNAFAFFSFPKKDF